jgi:hypothetical protein
MGCISSIDVLISASWQLTGYFIYLIAESMGYFPKLSHFGLLWSLAVAYPDCGRTGAVTYRTSATTEPRAMASTARHDMKEVPSKSIHINETLLD